MKVTGFDLLLIPIAYIYIILIIHLATVLKRKDIVSGEIARKIVHVGIGSLVIAAPLLFSSYVVPTLIGFTFIFITFLTSPISPITRLRLSAFKDGHGMGTTYYAFSLTVLLFLFFDHGWIIQAGFLPLVFGDAAANIIGKRYGKHPWYIVSNKSVEGSIGALVFSTLVLIIALSIYLLVGEFEGTFGLIIMIALIEGLTMSVVELVSPYGLDNLTIPFVCTFIAIVLGPVPNGFTLFIS